MKHMPEETLQDFDENSLPDLDVVVLGALELFGHTILPAFPLEHLEKPLVLGSGNAGVVGKILFEDIDACYVDESTYERILAKNKENIISAVIISASGGKHAVPIARTLQEQNIPTWLLTNNAAAPAGEYLDTSRVLVFPKNREPYTYNVSTYMSMLLSYTQEAPEAIQQFILNTTAKEIPDTLAHFDAFYLILPSQFILLKDMFLTKFDELFGSRVSARVFTFEQSKHAKTVVPSDTECFISFGEENTAFGSEKTRFFIPLPENTRYAAMMAIGYYVIGHIQKQHPPYFKDNIKDYTKKSSELFHESIVPIVE